MDGQDKTRIVRYDNGAMQVELSGVMPVVWLGLKMARMVVWVDSEMA